MNRVFEAEQHAERSPLVVFQVQPGEVESYPGFFPRVVQSLAGVHPLRLRLELLYDQGGGVDGQPQAAQPAGLKVELGSLAVVGHHRYVIVGSRFGEAPDEDGRHGGAAVQGDRPPHRRGDIGADVLHLLRV